MYVQICDVGVILYSRNCIQQLAYLGPRWAKEERSEKQLLQSLHDWQQPSYLLPGSPEVLKAMGSGSRCIKIINSNTLTYVDNALA
jgi:hypothetical protein